jgi:hypothetical protein
VKATAAAKKKTPPQSRVFPFWQRDGEDFIQKFLKKSFSPRCNKKRFIL